MAVDGRHADPVPLLPNSTFATLPGELGGERLPPRRRGSLGRRMVLATIGFCIAFTVLTGGLRSWWAWRAQQQAMSAEMALIEKVFQRSLSKAIWEMDHDAIETHVASAVAIPAVGEITLQTRQSGRVVDSIERRREGWQASAQAPVLESRLVYEPYPGASEAVGTLRVSGDVRLLWARTRSEVAQIVVTQVIQSILLAGLITWLFHGSVTVHVRRIARHLGALSPATLHEPLRLDRPGSRDDELGLLVSGVNHLQSSLSAYIEQRGQDERELSDHRDRLAGLVSDRTAELQALLAAQQMVLGLSHRLIRAPVEEFDLYQVACLAEVAQRLGASHALWYRRDRPDEALRLSLHWVEAGARAPVQLLPQRELPSLEALFEPLQQPLAYPSADAARTALGPLAAGAFLVAGVEALALVPLAGAEGEHYGFLAFGKRRRVLHWGTDETALLAMTGQLLLQAARHHARMLDVESSRRALQDANHRLEELSRTDALTGLANRRHFDEMKETEYRRALRSGRPLSVLLCDVDYFKRYNDAYGHARGDACLQRVAEALRGCFGRAGEMPARIGGEEFAVLLPATDRREAQVLAERLRLAISALEIQHVGSDVATHVTLSIGVAQLDARLNDDFDRLLQRADQALYRAKRAGRNRVAEVA